MDEEYRTRQIPPNFENGINVLGVSFKPIFLIEGGVLGILGLVIFFFLFKEGLGMEDTGQIIGYSLIFAAAGAFIGIKGINDEPLTTFIVNLKFFSSHRRTAFYNPRIKREARPYKVAVMENKGSLAKEDMIPRDRIIALASDIKEKYQGANAFVDESSYDSDAMVFEDDR